MDPMTYLGNLAIDLFWFAAVIGAFLLGWAL